MSYWKRPKKNTGPGSAVSERSMSKETYILYQKRPIYVKRDLYTIPKETKISYRKRPIENTGPGSAASERSKSTKLLRCRKTRCASRRSLLRYFEKETYISYEKRPRSMMKRDLCACCCSGATRAARRSDCFCSMPKRDVHTSCIEI